MMLVLTRKAGQRVSIGEAVVTVVACVRGKVRLGIEAPRTVVVLREEIGEKRHDVVASTASAPKPKG